MELTTVWTESAINQLKDIFDFYKASADKSVALKITHGIVKRTIQLCEFPVSGAKEALLNDRKIEYRYIVEKKYKIIYHIKGNRIIISAIFDCRRNPAKLKI